MPKDYAQLLKDFLSTADESKATPILVEILLDKEGRAFMLKLDLTQAELCIEFLDHSISEHNLRSAEKQAFFVTLRRLVEMHRRLPESMKITETIEIQDRTLASGGFADVKIGILMGQPVAVKKLRVAEEDDLSRIRKRFCKEVVLWNTLTHPNVLKLMGVQGDMGKGEFFAVSEWMTHGNVMEYIRRNPINRLQLLYEAAQGLKYLHDARLVHGDLKGTNILMSNHTPPRACLADFGFMTMVFDPVAPMSSSAQLEGGTTIFMSPELLMPSMLSTKNPIPTTRSDIYAFGLVVYQVLTGGSPFRGVRGTELPYAVAIGGMRPSKPEDALAIGFSDSLWDFVQRCWYQDATSRPDVVELVRRLGQAATEWGGVMPPSIQTATVSPSSEKMSSSSAHVLFRSSTSTTTSPKTTSDVFSSPPCSPFSGCTEISPELRGIVNPKQATAVQLDPIPLQLDPIPQLDPMPLQLDRIPSGPNQRSPLPGGSHDPQEAKPFPHLDQNYDPPPSRFPQRRRTGFRAFWKSKLNGFRKMWNRHSGNQAIEGFARDTDKLPAGQGKQSVPSRKDHIATHTPNTTVAIDPRNQKTTPPKSQPLGRATSTPSTTSPIQVPSSDVPRPTKSNPPFHNRSVSETVGTKTIKETKPDDPRRFPGALPKDIVRPVETPLVIQMILSGKNEEEIIRGIPKDGAQASADAIDEALKATDIPRRTRKKYLKTLYKICGHFALLPRVMQVSVTYDRTSSPHYGGGFADVWKGIHHDKEVAIKILRTHLSTDPQKKIKEFCKEAIVWRTLQHPNVLSLVGATMSENRFLMISDWMINGNINKYVKDHPHVDKIQLLEGVVKGLLYIHEQGVIHGDLKGLNILIDETGNARLADFGLSTIISEPTKLLQSNSFVQGGGTVRWMSPELIAPDQLSLRKSRPTKASDCYALGMVIYETISGHVPFNGLTNEVAALKVLNGERPPRVRGFGDDLWRMLESCWAHQAGSRPCIEDVLRCLEGISDSSSFRTDGSDDEVLSSDASRFPAFGKSSVPQPITRP